MYEIKTYFSGGRRSGFTLTEMVISLSLMMLMLGLALPNLVAFMPEYGLDRLSTRIRAEMKAARMEAMSAGIPARIDFDEGNQQFSIWTDFDEDGTTNSTERATHGTGDTRGTSFQVLHGGTASFRPDGTYDVDNTSLDLTYLLVNNTSTPRYDLIIVWPSGQISRYEYE